MTYPGTWNSTVTVYTRESAAVRTDRIDRWTRKVFTGCFFSTKNTRSFQGQTVSFGSSFICRIPSNAEITLSPGDIVALGELTDTMTAQNRLEILKRDNVFTIAAVKDNRAAGFLKHYAIEG